ncbi:MAG: hypothetical protein PHG82_02955 [Candidatus Gracilibacteria bacterium]|nr:hypothetical protein [Candidatus Gracilibacteria bacterium]
MLAKNKVTEKENKINVLFINLSISSNFKENTIVFEPNNISNQTLSFGLNSILKETNSKIINLLKYGILKEKTENIENLEILIDKIIEDISKLIEKSEKQGKQFILGISIIDNDIVFIKEILQKLNNTYKNLIIVGGGPSLKKYDVDIVEKLFSYGFDILNIGGGKEFIEILGKINSEEINLEKNENNEIILKGFDNKGKNILLKPDNLEEINIKGGTSLFVPIRKSESGFSLNVSFGEACLNNCKYCIVSQEKTSTQNKEKAILMLNERLETARKIELENNVEFKVPIRLQDPNPQSNLKKLGKNLDKLNLEMIENFTSFGDIYSFTSKEYVYELLEFIDKYKFNGVLGFGRDTIQAKNDGDIIGKTRKNEVLKQEEYDLVEENFFLFLDELEKKHKNGEKVASIEVNYIFHPDMDIELFIKKIDECKRISGYSFKTLINNYVLSTYSGSQVKKDYTGYFIDYTDIPLDFAIYSKNREPSFFGEQYKNSSLLDIMLIGKIFGPLFGGTKENGFNDFAYEIFQILSGNYDKAPVLKKIFSKNYIKGFDFFNIEYEKSNINGAVYSFLKDLFKEWIQNIKSEKQKIELNKAIERLEEWKNFIQFREKLLIEKSENYRKITDNKTK